jgi:hypothetical protein
VLLSAVLMVKFSVFDICLFAALIIFLLMFMARVARFGRYRVLKTAAIRSVMPARFIIVRQPFDRMLK